MKKSDHISPANSLKRAALLLLVIGCAGFLLESCKGDPLSPGVEYMPDMYRSPSIETYGGNSFYGESDSMAARLPVEGTIPRGFNPYPYPNSNEGLVMAGQHWKNPIPFSTEVLGEGKEIYTKFCQHCHGEEGKGDGLVVKNPSWPGPPKAYDNPVIKVLTEGHIFHVITHGKNMMGPHASQINQEDRWKLVYYIQELQGNDPAAKASGETMSEDADAEAEAETADAEAAAENGATNQ